MTGSERPIDEERLQAFIDGRLEHGEAADVEAALAERPDLAGQIASDRRYRDTLRAQLAGKFAEPVPDRLSVASLRAARRHARLSWAKSAAAAVALVTLGAAGGWVGGRYTAAPIEASAPSATAVAEAAASAYRTFVVEVAHPVEVPASNEAHLLRWLSKRLGRPLAAPELAQFGYRLMGGRLLPAGSGPAAQLMYEAADGRRLTVYVQAGDGEQTAFRFRQDGESATVAWIDRGFGFAVTAPGRRNELLPIAQSIYLAFEERTGSGSG